MRSYTTPSLTQIPNTSTSRTVGTASHLAVLVLMLASTSNSYAEISFKKIGDPVFEIAGHVTGSAPGRSSNVWNDVDNIFGPSHLVVGRHPSEQSGPEVGIVPIEEVDNPIGEHVRREFAASGRVNTNVFAVEEIFWDRSWMRLLSLSPTSTAPLGASPQNSNGPIIPNDIYPLTNRWKLYQNESLEWTPSPRTRQSLGSAGSQTLDDGTQIDFSELSFGDYVLPMGWGAGRGHTLDSLVGSFEHRGTLTDRNGNGWEYVVPIEAVRHPTDITGDLNYNGRFDVQDYKILQQNVEVAPAEPHGEFLRRLDLNGDSLVNADDTSHLASQFPTAEVTYLSVGQTYSQDFDSLGTDGEAGSALPSAWSVTDEYGAPVRPATNVAFPTSSRKVRNIDGPFALNVGIPEGEGMDDRSLAVYKPRDADNTAIQLLADTNAQADAVKIDFSLEAWDLIRSTSNNKDKGVAKFDVSVEIDTGDGTSDLSKIMGGDFTELLSLGAVSTEVLPKPDNDFLNGNDPAHRVSFEGDVLHADIPAGSRLRFRWESSGEADASEEWIFGIDDVSITLAAAGDADLDGEVTFEDFLALSANFGEAGSWEQGDFDGNGQVDFPDFLALSANFGGAANAAAPVPEPASLSITLFGLLGLIGFRKRR